MTEAKQPDLAFGGAPALDSAQHKSNRASQDVHIGGRFEEKTIKQSDTITTQIQRLGISFNNLQELNAKYENVTVGVRGTYLELLDGVGMDKSHVEPDSVLDKLTLLNTLIEAEIEKLLNTHSVLESSL